jgi:hypothetical protein
MPTRPKTGLLLFFSGGPSDTTRPTCVITTNATGPTATNPIAATITFSEEVTGFVVGDITVSAGGSLANFATADNIVFTADWTLAAGTNTMDVAEGVCADAAGNTNTAAAQYSIARYYVYDTFTDTNGTLVTAHTPNITPGGGYAQVFANPPDIQGNKVHPLGTASSVMIDAGVTSCTVRIKYTFVTGQYFAGLLLRVSDSSNYFRFYLNDTPAVRWELQKRAAAVNSVLDSENTSVTNGQTYTLKVTLNGNTITCYVDNVEVCSATDAFSNTVTKQGFMIATTSADTERLDDFEVFPL